MTAEDLKEQERLIKSGNEDELFAFAKKFATCEQLKGLEISRRFAKVGSVNNIVFFAMLPGSDKKLLEKIVIDSDSPLECSSFAMTVLGANAPALMAVAKKPRPFKVNGKPFTNAVGQTKFDQAYILDDGLVLTKVDGITVITKKDGSFWVDGMGRKYFTDFMPLKRNLFVTKYHNNFSDELDFSDIYTITKANGKLFYDKLGRWAFRDFYLESPRKVYTDDGKVGTYTKI